MHKSIVSLLSQCGSFHVLYSLGQHALYPIYNVNQMNGRKQFTCNKQIFSIYHRSSIGVQVNSLFWTEIQMLGLFNKTTQTFTHSHNSSLCCLGEFTTNDLSAYGWDNAHAMIYAYRSGIDLNFVQQPFSFRLKGEILYIYSPSYCVLCIEIQRFHINEAEHCIPFLWPDHNVVLHCHPKMKIWHFSIVSHFAYNICLPFAFWEEACEFINRNIELMPWIRNATNGINWNTKYYHSDGDFFVVVVDCVFFPYLCVSHLCNGKLLYRYVSPSAPQKCIQLKNEFSIKFQLN